MAVDTPARIVVLGAGPAGLEAALYGRFLGYDVTIFERGEVCERLLNCRPEEVALPAKHYCSRLGVAALLAQDETWWPPNPEVVLTGPQLRDAYFLPLSESDLLSGSLETRSEVVSVERAEETSDERSDDYDDEDLDVDESLPFRLLVRDAKGKERREMANVLIDTTGDCGSANWFTTENAPAPRITTVGLRPQGDLYRLLPLQKAEAEPSLYVVGASESQNSRLNRPQVHLAQIRAVFAIVGGRAGLDLYRTIQLPPEWQAFPVPIDSQ